jgi:hypothetical protein
VQESFGRVTGDAKSQADGLIKQAAGADLYGQAKDTASDAAPVVRQGVIDAERWPRSHDPGAVGSLLLGRIARQTVSKCSRPARRDEGGLNMLPAFQSATECLPEGP